MNAVSLPENAKKPKNSFCMPGGVKRPISERLADWFGPTNTPIRIPATQSAALSSARIASRVAPMRPSSEMTIVSFAPTRSSRKPIAAAPMPAARFSTMPKTSTSCIEKPNVSAA